jgi:hypothetical protein
VTEEVAKRANKKLKKSKNEKKHKNEEKNARFAASLELSETPAEQAPIPRSASPYPAAVVRGARNVCTGLF